MPFPFAQYRIRKGFVVGFAGEALRPHEVDCRPWLTAFCCLMSLKTFQPSPPISRRRARAFWSVIPRLFISPAILKPKFFIKCSSNTSTVMSRPTRSASRSAAPRGAMLLLGRDRAHHFPDAWIQAGRFQGNDKSRIVDRVEIRSFPTRGIEEAIAFVQKHALYGAEIGAVRRRERWNLPPLTVREAVINAVAHTDYAQRGAPICVSIFDDRLEVENPGLLPFGLTVEDLHRGISKLRNRVIGRVFHTLGLIEQWGSGVQRMSAACRDAGLAAPVF